MNVSTNILIIPELLVRFDHIRLLYLILLKFPKFRLIHGCNGRQDRNKILSG